MTSHLKTYAKGKRNPIGHNHDNSTNFEIGQKVMVKKIMHVILLNPNIYWTTRY